MNDMVVTMRAADLMDWAIAIFAIPGWAVLYYMFRSARLIGRWNVWSIFMALGAIAATAGALARLASTDGSIDRLGRWAIIVGLLIEGGPLLWGTLFTRKQRRR